MNERLTKWIEDWRIVGVLQGITADIELVAGNVGVDATAALASLRESIARVEALAGEACVISRTTNRR